jgi:hypothetical protein
MERRLLLYAMIIIVLAVLGMVALFLPFMQSPTGV